MTTTTRNEAAERLREHFARWADSEHRDLFDEALAAERRATVQRIRDRLTLFTINPNGIETPLRNLKTILAILDEEAGR